MPERMRARFRFDSVLFAGILILFIAGASGAPAAEAQTTVRVPDTTMAPSETVRLPIFVDGLAGQDVLSWQFDLQYDPAVLDTVTVEAQGSLAEGRRMTANTTSPGRLSVAVAGTAPVASGGVLMILRLRGGAPGRTPLTVTTMQFNEGTPEARAHNGQVTVVEADTSGASR